MEQYPAELVTPPLALIALLGCPELHKTVGEYLRAQHRPPINSIGLAEPQSAVRFFGDRKTSLAAPHPPTEILKADWFAKHRQKRPAVAVLFLTRAAVTGDPASWARCTADVDAVKAATYAGGGRIVVVIAQAADAPDFPEDTALLLCRQAGIERRCLLALCLTEPAGLLKLGKTLHEQSGVYYLDESRSSLSMHAERRAPPPEVNARTSFKAAAFAEFRADWSTAVKTYQTAYSQVQKIPLAGVLPYQHWHELTAVAEQVHIKVVTLLLHQHRSQEALSHFQQHLATYRKPPSQLDPVPSAAAASHWGWVARQNQAVGELMSSRVDPAHLPPQRDCHPAYFFLCAATAYTEQRREIQRMREAHMAVPGAKSLIPTEVKPGRGVGQLMVPNLQGGRQLTDPEFLAWLEEQQLQLSPAKTAIQMLTTAHELYKKSSQPASRLLYHIGGLMAREHLATEDIDSAKTLLESIAVLYRKEQWQVPLAAALLELRECAQRQHRHKEHVEYSLELACQQQFLGQPQRAAICQAAVRTLQGSTPPSSPLASPRNSGSGELGGSKADAMQLYVQSPSSGLYNCFALHCGFAPLNAQSAGKATPEARFGVALWSNLPLVLPVTKLEVVFMDKQGSYHHTTALQLTTQQQTSHHPQQASSSLPMPPSTDRQNNSQASPAPEPMQLQPEQWCCSNATFTPRHSGKLQAQAVVASVGSGSIVWELQNCLPDHMPLGQTGESLAAAQNPFLHTPFAGASGRWHVIVPVQHTAPQFQVKGGGYAMVGEQLPVTAVVVAADPLYEVQLSLKAEYLEGGGHSDLQIYTTLAADREPLQGTQQLPDLATEQRHVMQLYIPVTRRGHVHLSAKLQYCTTQDCQDKSQQISGLEVAVEQPFTTDFSFTAPPRTQSIMPPQDPLPASGGPQAGMAQSQGGSTSTPVIPLGSPAVMVACITAMVPCEIVIEDIQVQPSSNAAEVTAAATAVSKGHPVSMHKGDCHSCVLQVSASQGGNEMLLGDLAVTWSRASSDNSSHSNKQQQQQQQQLVTTILPLPSVSFQIPLLQAHVQHAAQAVAGQPLVLTIRLQSRCALLQSVEVTLKDSTGFVTAGPKHTVVTVLPHQDAVVVWRLVAYNAGLLMLPDIELTSQQHQLQLSACHARKVLVLPAKLANQRAADSGRLLAVDALAHAGSMSHLATRQLAVAQ